MTDEGKQTLQQMESVGPVAVAMIKDFFAAPVAEGDNKALAQRADAALKLLGRLNGAHSNRIKESALQFAVAKAVGIRGDALRPLLVESLASAQVKPQIQAPLEATQSAS